MWCSLSTTQVHSILGDEVELKYAKKNLEDDFNA